MVIVYWILSIASGFNIVQLEKSFDFAGFTGCGPGKEIELDLYIVIDTIRALSDIPALPSKRLLLLSNKITFFTSRGLYILANGRSPRL